MSQIVAISVGAALGANARYWLGMWLNQALATSLPVGTLFVNLSGSLVLGLFMTMATERVAVSPEWRLAVTVGFLGSYTTFSAFSYETVRLAADGGRLLGLGNVLLSVAGGLAGAWLGSALARQL